jgi:hypothetical protein
LRVRVDGAPVLDEPIAGAHELWAGALGAVMENAFGRHEP